MEIYIMKDNKKLRCGYTTGSCAAAAAKAALKMLLGGNKVFESSIITPNGIKLELPVLDIQTDSDFVSCAVQKDSGDDPDVTDKILIYAKTEKVKNSNEISIEGGVGVGKVTKPGLACEIGTAAINPVPRMMITNEVKKIIENFGYEEGIKVTISIPAGIDIAKKTFNPRLGIVGGISVLGTTGIVEPMSEKALIDSIKVEMQMLRAAGYSYLLVTPGNYGKIFAKMNMDIDVHNSIKCSNFIGDVIDFGVELGFKGLLFVGHAGKFIKIAGGVMNTHSRYADSRMEIITAHAAAAGVEKTILKQLMECVTIDDAIKILSDIGYQQAVFESLKEKIDFHFKARTYGNLEIEAVVFSNKYGILAKTEDADNLLTKIRAEEKEMTGKLYGVGIGPGDAELITVKAVKILKKCEVIAIPKSGSGESVALNIATQAVPEISDKQVIELNMPMTRDKKHLNECHEKAADDIIDFLKEGKNVAFITLGDPTIYSTYIYIHKIVMQKGYAPVIISGVPSFCAVAAKLGDSLTEASQPLHIIPASYASMEESISLSGTKVLMKTGRSFSKVKTMLKSKNLLPKSKMVQNCGMPDEKIYQNLEETEDSVGYFSIIVVKK